jgi:hypothetical protein
LYHLAYPPRRESSGVQAGDPILEENPGGPTSGSKFGTHFQWQIRGPTSGGKFGDPFPIIIIRRRRNMKHEETIGHLTSGCPILAKNEYLM